MVKHRKLPGLRAKVACKDRSTRGSTLAGHDVSCQYCKVTPLFDDYETIVYKKLYNLISQQPFLCCFQIEIREFKLQIWPGYKTTINQYENNILMVAEIAHKVVRLDTVLDVLRRHNTKSSYRVDFEAEVVGAVVLTDYNNKTYTIDDIQWNLNPSATFACKGEDVSYVNYYKKVGTAFF